MYLEHYRKVQSIKNVIIEFLLVLHKNVLFPSHQQYFWYIQHNIFMLNIFCLGVTDNTQHSRTQYSFKNISKQDRCSPLIRLFNEMSMNTSQVSIQKRRGLKSHSTLRTKKRLVRLKSMSHKVG